MSGEQDAPETIFDMVADMERDIIHVECWAKAFQAIASSNSRIDPDALVVMANALEELGDRQRFKFGRLFELAAQREARERRNP